LCSEEFSNGARENPKEKQALEKKAVKIPRKFKNE
jgi:hypothetical protein